VPSLGQLHEQPIGLAWITSGPYFERSEPFRFKRSVSGNRYRPMTTLDQSLPSWNTAVNQIANNTDAYTAPSAPQPAPGDPPAYPPSPSSNRFCWAPSPITAVLSSNVCDTSSLLQ